MLYTVWVKQYPTDVWSEHSSKVAWSFASATVKNLKDDYYEIAAFPEDCLPEKTLDV